MKKLFTMIIGLIIAFGQLFSQSVDVDVNLNIKHSVGGISDFGRERHITVHAAIDEPDWNGEEEKMNYLMNDLDVYFGRDNGAASWKFKATPVDPNRPNKPALDSMALLGEWLKGQWDSLSPNLLSYEDRAKEMIMGTNPHPTYPTLCYWPDHACGTSPNQWIPRDIETSAEWMAEYLDMFFAHSEGESGQQLPKYWEVINEPDMLLNTGAFMFSSWEDIWEYHNLVAKGVKERLGNKAPMIGGMTWGLHDLFDRDLGTRHKEHGYTDGFYGNTPADEEAKAYARLQTESAYWDQTGNEWFQWDVLWKGFVDAAGENMDFYAVHLYDWPLWKTNGGAIRSGGHVEATLDMLEWYDVNKFGTRKPIVMSEYGAVSGYIGDAAAASDPDRRDWENLKPFSHMMMQFLERPDYIIKSMPFTPIKAEWGNWSDAPKDRYPYTMMDKDANGNWQWSQFIKFYELWSDVKGTRIDTRAWDNDIQVDAYVNGNKVYLILDNLEPNDKEIQLNLHGLNGNSVSNVKVKHLFLDLNQGAEGKPSLTTTNYLSAPETITVKADATMILEYTLSENVTINQTSVEKKFYGESISGTIPNRKVISDGTLTAQINGVQVPSGPAEATLRLCGKFFYDHIIKADSRNKVTVNGTEVEVNTDWRGEAQGSRNTYFGVLEIPIPANLLRENNTITARFQNECTYTNVSLQVWDFSIEPGRSDTTVRTAVTEVKIKDILGNDIDAITVGLSSTSTLVAKVSPDNATDKTVRWKSLDNNIATVDASGIVTGVATGTTTIIVETNEIDGVKIDECSVTVSDIPVTGITLSETTKNIKVDDFLTLIPIVLPENASNKNITWHSDKTAIATVSNTGVVTGISKGENVTITATTVDGSFTATCSVNVEDIIIPTGLIIEAEDFISTDGTFNDGFVPYGVNKNGSLGINWVNSGDYADYSINIEEAGTYSIKYLISTPENNVQISIAIDGSTKSTDNVINNGQWDDYTTLIANNTVELSAGVHSVQVKATGSNNWQWNLDKIIFSKIDDIEVTEVILTKQPVEVTQVGQNIPLYVTVLPSDASNKSINWSSSDESVIAFENGSLIAKGSGTTIVTATAHNGISASTSYTLNLTTDEDLPTLIIEAEEFNTTGGTYSGFQTYTTATGVGAINWNQTGDWGEYIVDIPTTGDYEISYYVGTTVTGGAIEFILDGNTIMKDNVPNNGNWDDFTKLTASSTVYLTQGQHTIRLLGAGTNGWEWNMDKFILAEPGAVKTSKISENISIIDFEKITVYPNPTSNLINISGLNEGSKIIIYNLQGKMYETIQSSKNREVIDAGSYPAGVYLIKVVGKNTKVFKINKTN